MRLIGGGIKSSGGGKKGYSAKRKRKKRKKDLSTTNVPGARWQPKASGGTKKADVASVFVKAVLEHDRLEVSWVGTAAAERVKVSVSDVAGSTLHETRVDASIEEVAFRAPRPGATTVEVRGTSNGRLVARGGASVLPKARRQ